MTGRRVIAVGAAALALAAALPAAASASDYCVAPKADCGANNVSDLETALTDAKSNPGPDRVLLSEGTYVAQGPAGFTYPSFDPVEIAGAGRGKTILTAKAGSKDQVLRLLSGTDSSVHDLTIRIPQQVQTGFVGLDMRSTAERIDIVENPDQTNERRGARVDAPGVLEDSTVTLAPEGTIGVWMTSANLSQQPNVVRHSAITASTGVQADTGGAVERSNVTASYHGITAQKGDTTIANSVIRVTKSNGVALDAYSVGTTGATVKVDGSTIVGPGTTTDFGISATTKFGLAAPVEINLTNSIVRTGRPFFAEAQGSATATINASYSDYDPSTNQPAGANGVNAAINEANVQNAGDARFVDAANGDYRLQPGSPMIDAGDPASAGGIDLNGDPLVADGNADGIARRDIGAYELQPPPPNPEVDTRAPVVTGFSAKRARVRYTLSENAHVTVRIQRRLPGRHARYRTLGKVTRDAAQGTGGFRVGARLRAKEARSGRYRAVIVAIDATGNRSAPKAAGFRVRRR